jgi:hypothetical protein
MELVIINTVYKGQKICSNDILGFLTLSSCLTHCFNEQHLFIDITTTVNFKLQPFRWALSFIDYRNCMLFKVFESWNVGEGRGIIT